MELPMLIQRCLTYGVKIYPFQLKRILAQYEIQKVPDDKLTTFNALQIEKYVNALYLSSEEMSRDWSKGHQLLMELGFEEIKRIQGHRTYISLVFNSSFETSTTN